MGKPGNRRASAVSIAVALLACLLLLVEGGAAIAQNRIVHIQLRDGKASAAELAAPARGAPILRLNQGEEVELQFSSDRATALHLHGYDIETHPEPNAPATMRFTARAAGRFALEAHGTNGAHATLLYVEVYPR